MDSKVLVIIVIKGVQACAFFFLIFPLKYFYLFETNTKYFCYILFEFFFFFGGGGVCYNTALTNA